MKNYFKEIQTRLNNEIELEDIVIIDNSSKHKGHKFFSHEKYHLHLIAGLDLTIISCDV